MTTFNKNITEKFMYKLREWLNVRTIKSSVLPKMLHETLEKVEDQYDGLAWGDKLTVTRPINWNDEKGYLRIEINLVKNKNDN